VTPALVARLLEMQVEPQVAIPRLLEGRALAAVRPMRAVLENRRMAVQGSLVANQALPVQRTPAARRVRAAWQPTRVGPLTPAVPPPSPSEGSVPLLGVLQLRAILVRPALLGVRL
jgi:hypothetical protein